VSRRVSLPGADELFRTTGGTPLQSSTPRQLSGAEPSPGIAPAPAGTPRVPVAGGHEAPPPAARTADPVTEHARTGAEEEPPAAVPAARRTSPDHTVVQPRRERRAPNRRPSGRERHDEKITVYVSAEELMDLEHARLVLRGEHGLAVDRGRIVREAVAVVLADLESRGEASILVRRLRGR
jgi:hypothetical protein